MGRLELTVLLDVIADRLLEPTRSRLVHGEDDRFAAATLCILRRDLVGMEVLEPWVARLADLSSPDPRGDRRPVPGDRQRAVLPAGAAPAAGARPAATCLPGRPPAGADRAPAHGEPRLPASSHSSGMWLRSLRLSAHSEVERTCRNRTLRPTGPGLPRAVVPPAPGWWSRCSSGSASSSRCWSVSTTARTPTLWGFPFFYWFQFAMIPVVSVLTFVAFRLSLSATAQDRPTFGLPAEPESPEGER